jgi:exodeoxyribonuclease V alpha subunit
MNLLPHLEMLREAEVLADIDVHFARFAAGLAGSDDPALVLAACLVSHRIGAGHVCIDLREAAGRIVLPGVDDPAATMTPVVAPALGPWLAALRASPVVGEPGDDRPLVLDRAGRLYLHRYWRYERIVAADAPAPPAWTTSTRGDCAPTSRRSFRNAG